MRIQKSLFAGLVMVCGVWGAMFVTPAFAAAPEVPEVTVESITSTGATFSDVLNPVTFPVEGGTYQYLYKKTKTAGCVGEGRAPVPVGAYAGAEPEAFPVAVSNLAPDAYYTVCLHAEAETSKDAATSTPVTFETAPEAPGAPTVSPIEATTATLHGVLNPNSAGEAGTYEFLYQESVSECASGTPTTQEAATGAEKQAAKEVELTGLTPGVQYTVCLKLTNVAGETTLGPPVTFRALSVPPTVALQSTSSTEVTSESAKLSAEIVPGGGPTTYHFEYDTTPYITSAPHGTSTPESGSVGSDNAEHIAPASIGGLQPSTEYHYRVVATNGAGGGAGSTVDGPDETFTTQAAKGEFSLLDNRAWEQVSPTNKYGARIEGITREGGAIAAAANGSAMTYVANSPTTSEPAGNPSLAYSQVMSTRGPTGGWHSRDLAIPHAGEPTGLRVGKLGEYYAFTPNLENGIVEPLGAPPLAPNAKENTVVIRENLLEPAGASYTALTNENDTPAGTVFGRAVEFVASSGNLEHVLLSSNGVQLTATSGSGLYEWNKKAPDGELVPVSILPNEEFVDSLAAKFGDYSVNVRHAVSEDGDLVFWATALKLYMRDVPLERTVEIDLPQGVEAPEGAPEAFFQYATPDGERVYFRDGQRLTADATATASRPDLYEYNTTTGVLTDLTPDPKGQPGADMLGELIGASDNGANVYFVAEGILTEENPLEESEEEPNLYVIHTQGSSHTTRFIATLSKEDEHDWAKQPYVGVENDLQGVTSRMSPNGEYLAFMSDNANLLGAKGYDNHDAAEPHALDEEVLEYDASNRSIVCVSCNPTGARPQGVFDTEQSGEGLGLLVDRPEIWKNRWLAGSLPGWTARHLEQSDYQSRYLSDTGRLFFNSSDALVPQDTNGKEDVYEYEPTGVGGCTEGTSSGSSTYVPAGGCVGLISSGTSSKESAFLDASESGGDVFFLTSQPLSPADADDSGDVYDAHVCPSGSPCAGVTTAAPPPCATADSCKAASGSQPAIFGASGSATFSGAGNAAAPPAAVIRKSLTRAQKRAAALKACRSKPRKRRAVCEASARKRYGPPPRSRKPSRKGRK